MDSVSCRIEIYGSMRHPERGASIVSFPRCAFPRSQDEMVSAEKDLGRVNRQGKQAR